MIMSSTHWPAWSIEREPADLARYVVPGEVASLVRIPGTSGESALTRLNAVWEGLRSLGIGYVGESEGANEAGRLIRTPGEVLATPRNATGLDIALALAGACEHAGLASAIVLMDPRHAGQPQHPLVAVLLGQTLPPGWRDTEVWPQAPEWLASQVREDLRSSDRDVAVLDPVGLTHAPGESTIAGTDQSLELAAVAGHRYLTSGEWAWRLGVVTGGPTDAFVPAQVPAVLPLREIHRKPETTRSALRLLRAEYEVTPFEARDELTILAEICEEVEAGPRSEIVVVHGTGGSGKTRLALELAERQRRRGWYAGPLKEQLTEVGPTSLAWLAQVAGPLLVVVDDADARVGETQALLRALQDRPGTPAVVLLTARSLDGDWLETIQGDQSSTAHPLIWEALALPDTHPKGEEVFRSTFIAVRDAQDAQDRQDRQDRQDTESHSAGAVEVESLPVVTTSAQWTTLDLVLLGWLAALGSTDLPTTPTTLYDEVLTHEVIFWTRTFHDITGEDGPGQDVLSQAGAVLSLLRPTAAGADQALQALAGLSSEQLRDQVARTMSTCMDPGEGERLAVRPDPVGDHHLLKVLHDQPDLLHRALPIGTSPEALLGPLLVLNRAGQDDAIAAAHHLEVLVRAEPARWSSVLSVASALGGPAQTALETLVAASDCPLPLDELSGKLAGGATGLSRLAMLVDDRRLRTVDPSDAGRRAALLWEVSSSHGYAGDQAGALLAMEEAANAYRELAAADPAAFTHHLAGSLNSLSVQRAAAGDRPGGLSAIEEAAAAYRELAAADPAAFTHHLAGSLNNLSVQRAEAGDPGGGRTAIEEAVAAYRQLAAANPAAFTHHLAMSLNNLSVQRAETGDPAGALSAIEEAAASYRELAATNPAKFSPDLAMSLSNLSVRRFAVGDRAGALATTEEATDCYRELAAVDPSMFTPHLAMSLNRLSAQRAEVGDRSGALAAIEEAATLYRHLAAADAATFNAHFAGSLSNLSGQRLAAGDREGGLSAIEEAAASYRELAAGDPAAFRADLAGSLNNLSNGRAVAGDLKGALAAIEEAVPIYRELAAGDPAAFTANLAGSLSNLSSRRLETGDTAGALAAVEEAVALHCELAAADPAVFIPVLVASSNLMADQLAEAGQEDRATDVWEQSRTTVAVPQLRAYVTAAAAAWHDRRGDRAGAQARVRQAADEALDPAGSEQAGDQGPSVPDFAVGESRRYLRSVVMSMDPVPEGLPSWTFGPIHDLDLALAREWGMATTWSEGAAVLRERSEVVTGPTLSETLDTLLVLHPGDQRLTGLAAVHEAVVERGLSQVLADLSSQEELQTLIDDWLNTDSWTESFTYLAEHVDRLRTPEVVQRLVALQNPTASQHAAILTLWDTTSPQEVEELVTNAPAAAELALAAVGAGDLARVQLLTLVNPHTLELPGTGPLLQSVLLVAAGDQDRAAAAARTAAETATEDQRRAHTAALGSLAGHAEAVRGGSAAVTDLVDAYVASISTTPQNDAEAGPSRAPTPSDE